MKQYLITALIAAIFFSSCGSSSKDNNAAINDKKVALEKLKGEKGKLEEKIKSLETDLIKLDPASSTAQKAKLNCVLMVSKPCFAAAIFCLMMASSNFNNN